MSIVHPAVRGENAVLVGQRLLQTFGGIQCLHRADFNQLCSQHGLGPAKAAQLKAALELGNRLRLAGPEEKPAIHSPADALVQYEMSALEQEELRVLLLDTRNQIIAHNHPSGDPTPSPDDVAVTRSLVQAGQLLDIEVLGHLVIGMGRYVSLKERGLGF